MLEQWLKGILEKEQLLNKLYIKYYSQADYGGNLSAITESQQKFCFAYEFVKEVNTGGFDQYFFNAAGDHAHQTVEALQSIGATQSAALLQLAISVWPGQQVPQDWQTRRDVQEEIQEEAEATWEDCTRRFYKGREGIISLLIAYMNLHPAVLKE
jgi:hypothetical protein